MTKNQSAFVKEFEGKIEPASLMIFDELDLGTKMTFSEFLLHNKKVFDALVIELTKTPSGEERV